MKKQKRLHLSAGLLILCCAAFAQRGWQERDRWQKPAEVMNALHVAANSHVADVGAGSGYFTLRLAQRVGSGGKVYAVDVDLQSLSDLSKLADENHLSQVQVVEGAPDDPHLPAGELDAVLIVNAYHEFRQHDQMLQAIRRALKPGGYLGIIEKADEPGEPRANYERRHHLPEQFVREDLARNGFPEVEKNPDFHPSQEREGEVWFFLVAKKPTPGHCCRRIEAVTTTAPALPGAAPPEVEARKFTLRQRLLLWLTSSLGYLAIRLIGPTLRLSVSYEEGAREHEPQHPSIYCFWHRCVFPATYCFRNHRIAVMTSRSFDGEYIARIIERAGYTAVRGSSSRGGAGALLGMHDVIENGYSVAFTADGPRGPRYITKPGPVLLARNTGVPIVAFHIALDDPWLLPSWDQFMIPKPFSRGLLRCSHPLWVPKEAAGDGLSEFYSELQKMLDRTRIAAEEMLARGEHRRLPVHHWTRER